MQLIPFYREANRGLFCPDKSNPSYSDRTAAHRKVIKRPRAGSSSAVLKEVQKAVPCSALLTPLLSFYRYVKKVEHKVCSNKVEEETQDRGSFFLQLRNVLY